MDRHLVSTFHSTAPGSPHTYTFCGLHLASRQVLDFIPPAGRSSIIDAYARAMRSGRRVAGVCPRPAFWADVGTPEGYLDAHSRVAEAARRHEAGRHFLPRRHRQALSALRRSGASVEGWASVAPDARIERPCTIRNSIVWRGAVLRRHAILDHAIAAENARITGRLAGMAIQADRSGNPSLLAAIEQLGWPPARTLALPFPPRGSARRFTRIRHGRSSAIVIEYSLERPENGLYVQNARLLRAIGVPAPRIILDLPDRRVTVTEDAGDCSLGDWIAGRPEADVVKTYESVIRIVRRLHARGARAAAQAGLTLCEPFSESLYHWERDLFATYYLRGRLRLPDSAIRGVMTDLESVAGILQSEPPVLLHRDLQSSNILFHRGRPTLIDFQSMRLGPPLYDVASLLCDPYVRLSLPAQRRLLACYPLPGSAREQDLLRRFWIAAMERLIQAIGAYARLALNRETAHFARHIRPALEMLDRALGFAHTMPNLRKTVWLAQAKEGE